MKVGNGEQGRDCFHNLVVKFFHRDCLLPSAFCLLPSASCLLPPAFCLLPSASCLGANGVTNPDLVQRAKHDRGKHPCHR
ncbi:MAG: hypothetical protein F6K47_10140 [Symploca sp. SIO2E6]|nr:hypothetical protein [Symploca sp. SIO2E6]